MCEDTTGWFYASSIVFHVANVKTPFSFPIFNFVPTSYLKMLEFLDQLVLRNMKLGIPRE